MDVDYYAKYLKYKNKYIELKKQMGGVDDEICLPINTKELCSINTQCFWDNKCIKKENVNPQINCIKFRQSKQCTDNSCHWDGTMCVNNKCNTRNNNEKRTQTDCDINLNCQWKIGKKGPSYCDTAVPNLRL